MLLYNSIFTTSAKIANAGIKSKDHAERAIFVLFFSSGPALTIYPARAIGWLSGKYEVVRSIVLPLLYHGDIACR
jgi:hypothetical protein